MSDVIIIGAGPAGISAALYTIRSGLETTVITAGDSALAKAEKIENYYGFAEPISGKELLTRGIDGAERLGVKFTNKQAVSIDYEDGGFSVVTSDDKKHGCKAVLLATGSRRLAPSIEGLTEFEGKGVSYCAVCDAFFYRGKEVTVIGGGDSAIEEAVYLSKMCSKVYLVHRRDTYRAAPSTIEHMKHAANIEEVTNVTVEEVYGDMSGVQGLKVKHRESGEIRDLPTPGVFVFVGRDVLNAPLKQEDGSFLCDLNEAGEVVVDLRMRTSVKGLYAAGDIRIDAPKQVVCAAGDGATAAVNIIEYLG